MLVIFLVALFYKVCNINLCAWCISKFSWQFFLYLEKYLIYSCRYCTMHSGGDPQRLQTLGNTNGFYDHQPEMLHVFRLVYILLLLFPGTSFMLGFIKIWLCLYFCKPWGELGQHWGREVGGAEKSGITPCSVVHETLWGIASGMKEKGDLALSLKTTYGILLGIMW